MFAATYPVVNRLSGGIAFNPVRRPLPQRQLRPLLGQELEVRTKRAWDVESFMAALLKSPECLDQMASKHGRAAIDALLNKAVQISKEDRQNIMGLTSQESTLLDETVACLHPDPIKFSTVLIGGAVLGIGMAVFLMWYDSKSK